MEQLHCSDHWSGHAACWVAWAVLYAILKEAKGAIVKVQQYAHTITLGVAASRIAVAAGRRGGTIVAPDGGGCDSNGVAWRGRSCGAVGRTAQSARSDCVRGVRRASTPRLVWGAQGVRVGRMRASTTSTSMSRRGRRSSVGGRRPTCVAASASASASGSPYARSAKPD